MGLWFQNRVTESIASVGCCRHRSFFPSFFAFTIFYDNVQFRSTDTCRQTITFDSYLFHSSPLLMVLDFCPTYSLSLFKILVQHQLGFFFSFTNYRFWAAISTIFFDHFTVSTVTNLPTKPRYITCAISKFSLVSSTLELFLLVLASLAF